MAGDVVAVGLEGSFWWLCVVSVSMGGNCVRLSSPQRYTAMLLILCVATSTCSTLTVRLLSRFPRMYTSHRLHGTHCSRAQPPLPLYILV